MAPKCKHYPTRFLSKEHALEVLNAPVVRGWDKRKPNYKPPTRLRPSGPRNRFLFERVPPERRPMARQRFDDMVRRWIEAHPGQQMSQGKRASLIGNATCWAMWRVTGHLTSHIQVRIRRLNDARRYLKSLELEEFKSQPLSKRVKRLL